MIGTWLLLLAIAGVAWAWMDALAARERAIGYGREICRSAGVQLLDQTVALRRIRIEIIDGLPALVRRYGFEVSLDGSDRHRGQLEIGGHALRSWSLPQRPPPAVLDAPVTFRIGN